MTGRMLLLAVADGQQASLLDRLSREELLDCQDIFSVLFPLSEPADPGGHDASAELRKKTGHYGGGYHGILSQRMGKKYHNLCRRELLKLQAFYQQMMDMCEILADNDCTLFPEEYTRHFSRLSDRIDRLYDHTQMLREYALQIREIYQSQMDLKQNDTMRMLTVVTTIFLPLSLLTGWYGMNFDHMPELHEPAAYFILIGVCAAIILLEIWYFKKKGWL